MQINLGSYLHDALDKIENISTVESFYHKFEAIKALVAVSKPDLPEPYFASRFVYGLQTDYQRFVLRFNPITVVAAYRLALIYEESLSSDYFPELSLPQEDVYVKNSVAVRHEVVPKVDRDLENVIAKELPSESTKFLESYLHDALDQIEHTSGVYAFYHRFEAVKSLVKEVQPWLTEAYFASRFVYGLQEQYQIFVLRCSPMTVMAAFRLALIFEESLYLDYFPEDEMPMDKGSEGINVAENSVEEIVDLCVANPIEDNDTEGCEIPLASPGNAPCVNNIVDDSSVLSPSVTTVYVEEVAAECIQSTDTSNDDQKVENAATPAKTDPPLIVYQQNVSVAGNTQKDYCDVITISYPQELANAQQVQNDLMEEDVLNVCWEPGPITEEEFASLAFVAQIEVTCENALITQPEITILPATFQSSPTSVCNSNGVFDGYGDNVAITMQSRSILNVFKWSCPHFLHYLDFLHPIHVVTLQVPWSILTFLYKGTQPVRYSVYPTYYGRLQGYPVFPEIHGLHIIKNQATCLGLSDLVQWNMNIGDGNENKYSSMAAKSISNVHNGIKWRSRGDKLLATYLTKWSASVNIRYAHSKQRLLAAVYRWYFDPGINKTPRRFTSKCILFYNTMQPTPQPMQDFFARGMNKLFGLSIITESSSPVRHRRFIILNDELLVKVDGPLRGSATSVCFDGNVVRQELPRLVYCQDLGTLPLVTVTSPKAHYKHYDQSSLGSTVFDPGILCNNHGSYALALQYWSSERVKMVHRDSENMLAKGHRVLPYAWDWKTRIVVDRPGHYSQFLVPSSETFEHGLTCFKTVHNTSSSLQCIFCFDPGAARQHAFYDSVGLLVEYIMHFQTDCDYECNTSPALYVGISSLFLSIQLLFSLYHIGVLNLKRPHPVKTQLLSVPFFRAMCNDFTTLLCVQQQTCLGNKLWECISLQQEKYWRMIMVGSTFICFTRQGLLCFIPCVHIMFFLWHIAWSTNSGGKSGEIRGWLWFLYHFYWARSHRVKLTYTHEQAGVGIAPPLEFLRFWYSGLPTWSRTSFSQSENVTVRDMVQSSASMDFQLVIRRSHYPAPFLLFLSSGSMLFVLGCDTWVDFIWRIAWTWLHDPCIGTYSHLSFYLILEDKDLLKG